MSSKHNPNPFDFVPFPKQPIVRSREEFDALGPPVSGYLELSLKALTPVHIVGAVEDRGSVRHSHFVRQDDRPYIPAATLRGCLRAFVEALTGGWVSQANLEYPKVSGKIDKDKGRHIGFRTFAEYANEGKSMSNREPSPPAIDPAFQPSPGNLLDVASYLFGVVAEPPDKQRADHDTLAFKSKLFVEDAYLKTDNLSGFGPEHHTPDITFDDSKGGEKPNAVNPVGRKNPKSTRAAFMGGGKPNASNWWYFQPRAVWNRSTRFFNRKTGKMDQVGMAEFVGGQYRGRKFYFHQDPVSCTRWYKENWSYGKDQRPQPIYLEAVQSGKTTDTFRIYLDRVPEPLAHLMIMALLPGDHIRHKLGYGKAYGYGSVEFALSRAMLRYPAANRIPAPLTDHTARVQGWASDVWQPEKLKAAGLAELIDRQALGQIAVILTWEEGNQQLFTYPRYAPEYFKQPVVYENTRMNSVTQSNPQGFPVPDDDVGRRIAFVMYRDRRPDETQTTPVKKTIHFRVYQENSDGWSKLKLRRP